MVRSILDVAGELAQAAAERLRELRQAPLQKERKADKSWVTNADHESDRLIRHGLREAFPDHAILTEESGLEGNPSSSYVWVVDPLDGTKAFIQGIPGYSVMIGLLKNGSPYAGAVADPVTGRLYLAERGAGCFLLESNRKTPLHVSSRRHWSEMPVITSTGFPETWRRQLQGALSGPWLDPINSVGIKVGYLVRQEADLYVNHHGVHYWDTLAPQAILEEAGGKFTLLDGRPLVYTLHTDHRHPGPTLASNGCRHEDTLTAVNAIGV